MKLIIKGNIEVLRRFSIIQGIYTYLDYGISVLQKEPFIEEKREIEFVGKGTLFGYFLKLIENQKTKNLTVILK